MAQVAKPVGCRGGSVYFRGTRSVNVETCQERGHIIDQPWIIKYPNRQFVEKRRTSLGGREA